MPNSFPKLHNAMWPGLVGKESETDHPPISLDRMLKLTTEAMRKMNAAVDIDKQTPAAVAKQFLEANNLL